MAKEYLDKDGLLYFWQKIKNTFALASHTHTKSQITDFPAIPSKTSDLTNDSNFVADSSYVHTDNNFTTTLKNKLNGIATGAEVNVQADWNVTDTSSDAYIKNKPTIPAQVNVDSALSSTSENPVQNKVINTALGNKVDKVTGKGLSTNDYDATAKGKVDKLVFNGNEISSSILPSYVDDVIEAYARSGQTALSSAWLATGSASGTVITPEAGKIYVLMADSGDYSANTQFRWGGTAYVKMADGGVSSITNAEIDTIVAS